MFVSGVIAGIRGCSTVVAQGVKRVLAEPEILGECLYRRSSVAALPTSVSRGTWHGTHMERIADQIDRLDGDLEVSGKPFFITDNIRQALCYASIGSDGTSVILHVTSEQEAKMHDLFKTIYFPNAPHPEGRAVPPVQVQSVHKVSPEYIEWAKSRTMRGLLQEGRLIVREARSEFVRAFIRASNQ